LSLYTQRGVSAQKEEVHQAVQNLDHGLYPQAFCKLYEDTICGDANWVNVMHADGAGTKSILAYLYWKETGDLNVWKGIAQDAISMNLDDLLCVGIYDQLLFSSTIGRNKNLIPGEVLKAVIEGTQEFFDNMKTHGVRIQFLGGETADIGDVVRTMVVDGTMTARWPKAKLVTNEKIKAGDVIVGLASFGQAIYENNYNSGIGSNGLTSARHDVLSKHYAENFKESFDPSLKAEVTYIGQYKLTDRIPQQTTFTPYPSPDQNHPSPETTIGHLLLSPTRTYAPVMKHLLENHFADIHGLIHCSGGGQTKCLKYLPKPLHIIKDHLFEAPLIFQLIAQSSGADAREMYQVFNMGHRLEIFTSEAAAANIIASAQSFGIDAKIIGRVEDSEQKKLSLQGSFGELVY
jgi:phosphoribosylformylglycinamidine cyclo-ligase